VELPDQMLKPEFRVKAPEVLEAIENFVRRFVVFSNNHQSTANTLWVIHTHTIDAAEATPYLGIESPEKRSGKTRLLEVDELLVARPWRVLSPSEAVLFRKIEADRPTLLLDEIDTVFKDRSGTYEPVRAILNAGNRRGTTVPRCVTEGKKTAIQDFSVWCAKALAGIGELPDTVSDRAITIKLKRRNNEPIERFSYRKVSSEAQPIREAIEKFAEINLEVLREARPDIPSQLPDRAADAWEPLFAIADLAGGEWPEKARQAALALHSEDDDQSVRVLLLTHIKRVFEDKERMSTAELLRGLIDEEEGPWAEWWGNAVERGETKGPAARLARLLKAFDISPKGIRLSDGTTPRGYEVGQFEDAWARYLPPLHLNHEKSCNNATEQVNTTFLTQQPEGDKSENNTCDQECCNVACLDTKHKGKENLKSYLSILEERIHLMGSDVCTGQEISQVLQLYEHFDSKAGAVKPE
jgi:hypothetical protein